MTRIEANRKILRKLKKAVEDHPDWRFNQLLQNYDVVLCAQDMFYDESAETLARIEAASMLY